MEGQAAADRQGEEQHEGKTFSEVGPNALAPSLSGPYDDRRGQQQTLPQAHGTEGVNLGGSAIEDKMDGRKAVVEKEPLDVRDFLPAPTTGANDQGPDAEALLAWKAGAVGHGTAGGEDLDAGALWRAREASKIKSGLFDVMDTEAREPKGVMYAYERAEIEKMDFTEEPNAGNVRVNGTFAFIKSLICACLLLNCMVHLPSDASGAETSEVKRLRRALRRLHPETRAARAQPGPHPGEGKSDCEPAGGSPTGLPPETRMSGGELIDCLKFARDEEEKVRKIWSKNPGGRTAGGAVTAESDPQTMLNRIDYNTEGPSIDPGCRIEWGERTRLFYPVENYLVSGSYKPAQPVTGASNSSTLAMYRDASGAWRCRLGPGKKKLPYNAEPRLWFIDVYYGTGAEQDTRSASIRKKANTTMTVIIIDDEGPNALQVMIIEPGRLGGDAREAIAKALGERLVANMKKAKRDIAVGDDGPRVHFHFHAMDDGLAMAAPGSKGGTAHRHRDEQSVRFGTVLFLSTYHRATLSPSDEEEQGREPRWRTAGGLAALEAYKYCVRGAEHRDSVVEVGDFDIGEAVGRSSLALQASLAGTIDVAVNAAGPPNYKVSAPNAMALTQIVCDEATRPESARIVADGLLLLRLSARVRWLREQATPTETDRWVAGTPGNKFPTMGTLPALCDIGPRESGLCVRLWASADVSRYTNNVRIACESLEIVKTSSPNEILESGFWNLPPRNSHRPRNSPNNTGTTSPKGGDPARDVGRTAGPAGLPVGQGEAPGGRPDGAGAAARTPEVLSDASTPAGTARAADDDARAGAMAGDENDSGPKGQTPQHAEEWLHARVSPAAVEGALAATLLSLRERLESTGQRHRDVDDENEHATDSGSTDGPETDSDGASSSGAESTRTTRSSMQGSWTGPSDQPTPSIGEGGGSWYEANSFVSDGTVGALFTLAETGGGRGANAVVVEINRELAGGYGTNAASGALTSGMRIFANTVERVALLAQIEHAAKSRAMARAKAVAEEEAQRLREEQEAIEATTAELAKAAAEEAATAAAQTTPTGS
jgi:hypothetical protein